MNRVLILILFFIGTFGLNTSAQDSVMIVSSDMFYEHQQIRISFGEGWAFKKGNNVSWADIGSADNPYIDMEVYTFGDGAASTWPGTLMSGYHYEFDSYLLSKNEFFLLDKIHRLDYIK